MGTSSGLTGLNPVHIFPILASKSPIFSYTYLTRKLILLGYISGSYPTNSALPESLRLFPNYVTYALL